jgi:hypothetical protein
VPDAWEGKSWSRTLTGAPDGAHSRPGRAKGPICSFFLVSTLITGSPAWRNSATVALRCRNWASLSGWWLPASTRALPRRLNPAVFSRAATVSRPTFRPWAATSSARRRNDFVVHVSGFIGSPCVLSSTSASRAGTRVGSFTARAGRPAPGRRTRPSGSSPASSSARPRRTHPLETPAARATAAIPPRPSCRASAAYRILRCRSLRCGVTASSFSRNDPIDPSKRPIPRQRAQLPQATH